jgi:hypothetical protein
MKNEKIPLVPITPSLRYIYMSENNLVLFDNLHSHCGGGTLFCTVRVTLDQDPGTNEFMQSYWWKALKLVPRSLNEGVRPKSGKIEAKLTWHLFWREKSIGLVRTQKQR